MDSTGNLLLDALGPELEDILPDLREEEYGLREVLIHGGQRVKQVYFPTRGMISLITTMEDGGSVEMATVGREGMACVPTVFSKDVIMKGDAVVQMPMAARTMDAAIFLERAAADGRFRELVDRYAYALFAMVSQNAACNRMHSAQARASRWLLMAHDRAGTDTFPMTHEFLSQMLGARRATVTEVAQDLQDRGGIRYHRGTVDMLDRHRMEATACECYEVVRSVFDGLYD